MAESKETSGDGEAELARQFVICSYAAHKQTRILRQQLTSQLRMASNTSFRPLEEAKQIAQLNLHVRVDIGTRF